jgi:hypothetical protein
MARWPNVAGFHVSTGVVEVRSFVFTWDAYAVDEIATKARFTASAAVIALPARTTGT